MIKKYLIRFSFACLLVCLSIFLLYMGMWQALKNSSFKIQESKNILILGDSHTAYSIDDEIFDRSINLSMPATGYAFSYITLKKMLEANPQIDTVLVSFHQQSIQQSTDSFFLMGKTLDIKMRDFAFYADMEDLAPIAKSTDFYRGIIRAPLWKLSSMFKKKITGRHGIKTLGVGRFQNLYRNKLSQDLERVKEGTFDVFAEIDTTTLQWHYLMKINEYCLEKGVHIFLLEVPLYHPSAYMEKAKFDSLKNVYLPYMQFFDFSDFPLADSCYADITHLNYKGAKVFSTYLQEIGLNQSIGF